MRSPSPRDTTLVCNIGPQGQSQRKRIGMILLLLAGILTGYFIATNAQWYVRLLVFPLFAGGFIYLLEGETRVCVRLALQKKVDPR